MLPIWRWLVNWYEEYCKEFGYSAKSGRRGERDAERMKRRVEKAATLSKEDLSSFTDRASAEAHLEDKAVGMYGSFGFMLFQALISWVIRRILDSYFGAKNDNSSNG
jgi:hypothetical protein